MEIARRAFKPIEFDFTDVDATHAFFALKVIDPRVRDRCAASLTFSYEPHPGGGFDFMQNHLKITGELYPEDVTELYGLVFTALDFYLSKLAVGLPLRFRAHLSRTARARRRS